MLTDLYSTSLMFSCSSLQGAAGKDGSPGIPGAPGDPVSWPSHVVCKIKIVCCMCRERQEAQADLANQALEERR